MCQIVTPFLEDRLYGRVGWSYCQWICRCRSLLLAAAPLCLTAYCWMRGRLQKIVCAILSLVLDGLANGLVWAPYQM